MQPLVGAVGGVGFVDGLTELDEWDELVALFEVSSVGTKRMVEIRDWTRSRFNDELATGCNT